MKVKQLIAELKRCDQEADALVCIGEGEARPVLAVEDLVMGVVLGATESDDDA